MQLHLLSHIVRKTTQTLQVIVNDACADASLCNVKSHRRRWNVDDIVTCGMALILRRFDQWLSSFWTKIWLTILSPFWLTAVAVLTNDCRRFDQKSSPFWPMLVTVLTNGCRRFDSSCHCFDHCCRRFVVSPFLLSPFRLVAVMTGTHFVDVSARKDGRFGQKIWTFRPKYYYRVYIYQWINVISSLRCFLLHILFRMAR